MRPNIIIVVTILLVVIIGGLVYIYAGDRIVDDKSTVSMTPSLSSQPEIEDLIIMEKPLVSDFDNIRSPLEISGKARGFWFFEASFPIKIYDANNKQLGVAVAQAQGEWMTEDFVTFEAVLYFDMPSTQNGTLVLQKDNPSGLPENEKELRIPIQFSVETSQAASSCRPTGCSAQICADQDVVTTCEFKPEYACYKTAKCERQEDGNCGWTPTEKLVTCLSEAFQAEQ